MQQKDDSAGPFEGLMQDYETRRAAALAMGGPEKLARRAKAGVLNARERIALLLDESSFEEVDKLVTHRCRDFGMEDQVVPGDGFVTGYGRIDGRLRVRIGCPGQI